MGSRASKRDHLNKVWKQTKRKPAELENVPELPKELEYLWRWYKQLQSRIPLTWQEIESWSKLTAWVPTPAESETLKHLDAMYRSIVND